MAISKPKKPKLKSIPGAPKKTASMESWKAYENKVKQIESDNDKKISEYKKKLSAYESEMKKRESIKNKASKAKSKLSGF